MRRLAQEMAATCRGGTSLVVGLDEDDADRYERLDGVEYEVRKGLLGFGAWANELAVPRAGDYRFIGALGDDCVPRTPGWDEAIMGALEHTPFAFADDLYALRAPGVLATHVFTRGSVIRALGYLAVPSLRHYYIDNAWTEWGRACGMTFLPDTVIEHMHWSAGKSRPDATYSRPQQLFGSGQPAFEEYCRSGGLDRDIAVIRGQL